MSGTFRTDSYLYGTAFQDGQPAASITPSDMRDLVASKSSMAQPRNLRTTSATLAISDLNACVEMDSTSPLTLTVPPNSSVAFPVGAWVDVYQKGTGGITLVQGAGVTIRTPSNLIMAVQYITYRLVQRATDEWVLVSPLPFGLLNADTPPGMTNNNAVLAGSNVIGTGFTYTYNPTSAWSGVTGSFLAKTLMQGSADGIGSAHVLGGIFLLEIQNTGGTIGLAMGGEHRCQIDGPGVSVTNLTASEHLMGDIAAGSTVGLVSLSNNHIGDVNGTVTIGIAGNLLSIDNISADVPFVVANAVLQPSNLNGNITTFANLYMANLGTVPGTGSIVNRYFALNLDPLGVTQTAGTIVAASGREVVSPPHPGIGSGRFYFGVAPQQPLTTEALIAGVAIVSPIFIPHRQTFGRLGFEITTAATGTNIQVAIYAVSAGLASGAPKFFSANHSGGSVGAIEETGLSISLEGGLYWLCILSDGAATVRAFTDYAAAAGFGYDTSNTTANTNPAILTTINPGTPSASWSASPTTIYGAAAAVYPQVWLRT